MSELRLGTRGSQLALWQARTVAALITAAGGPSCRIEVIRTSGDQLQEAPLSAVGGKRLFVKEIEDALLRGEIDLAVHSSKDMPAVLPEGLDIAGVLPREDPYDAVVLPEGVAPPAGLDDLAAVIGRAPRVGTGSIRRIAQLTRLFPGARFTAIRGNLDTRLRRLDAGDYDALVLAAAGLKRLGFGRRISWTVPVTACIPAPGQGIVAVEARTGDRSVHAVVSRIDNAAAAAALRAERALVEALGGGCQTPIGALALLDGRELSLVAVVAAVDGTRVIRADGKAAPQDAAALGARVAGQLIDAGAAEILAEASRTPGAVEGIQP
jgi:hydroxymethylbilane synthase